MKNLFAKKQEETTKTATDSLEKPMPVNTMPVFEKIPPPPVKTDLAEKKWKAFKANSLTEATGFLNETGIDPKFMFGGSNGQINIFYKA